MTGTRIDFDEGLHRYSVNGSVKPSVTQVLAAAKLIDLEGIPEAILMKAALRGTRVHAAGRLLLLDELDWGSIAPEIGGYVRALDAFLRHSRFNADLSSVERPLYCLEHDYCGTPDAVGPYPISGGRNVFTVVDWKTGMMPGVRYQLAAYAHALGVRHRLAVKLNRDGTYAVHWFPAETLRQDLAIFLFSLEQTRREGRWAA